MNRTMFRWLAAAAAAAPLGAQAHRVPVDTVRYEATLGLTMSQTANVNSRPACTNLGLPCETSGREFPDIGFLLEGARHVTSTLAVVVEASLYFNGWDTTDASGTARQQTNEVGALLAGGRLISPALYPFAGGADPVFFYAQILAGPEASSVAPTRLALQPGIGVYSPLFHSPCESRWTDARFRLSWDYRWTRGQPRNLSGGRAVLAVSIGE
jgi:hypothetical protein